MRPSVIWSVGVLSLGGLTGALAAGASSGASGLSLVLRPNHFVGVASAPHGAVAAQPGWASTNWSGYAATSSTPYTSVSGQWTVPTVTGPNGSYSAAWVGIDGYSNSDLIQTGTEQDYSNGGQYSAWWTTSSQNFAEQTITSGCTTGAGPQSGATNVSTVTRSALEARTANAGPLKAGPNRSARPSAKTGSATSITSSGATLNGTVNPNGSATEYFFEYGTTTRYGSATSPVSAGSGRSSIAVSAPISSLSASTTYHFELVAVNSRGTSYGGDASFTTSSGGGGGGGGGGSCGTVAAGDVMTATISQTSPSTSTWTITISNTSSTHGWTFTKSLTYTGPGASAEWILEAPSLCYGNSCTVGTLANYGSTVFDPGTANGGSPKLTASEGGEIVNSSDTKVLSIPSGPDTDTDGFAVAYGSTAPNPPSS
ncbi:MAG: G1 family glutamic endopeptidase [Acidimicrobiales bacterium]